MLAIRDSEKGESKREREIERKLNRDNFALFLLLLLKEGGWRSDF